MNNEKILNKLKINFEKNINEIEEKVYSMICKNDRSREDIIKKNIMNITEDTINEFIRTDLEVRKCNKVWIVKNLDSFYNIKMKSIEINEEESKKILPRTKEHELRLKIINANIVLACLKRIDGIILYTKLKKKDYNEELKEKIKFTKGYLVCFTPDLVEKIKNYEYVRKKINNKPLEIKYIGKETKVIDVINNKNYSSPIWIKDNEICKIETENLKIFGNILNEEFDNEKLINIINYLNKTEISYDKEILKKIDIIANNKKIIDINIMSKNSLIDDIYQINKEEDIDIITDEMEITTNKENFINNAATYELIKKQLKEFENENFFFKYVYDSRARIYNWNWPINYQLNHIVRNVIKLKKKHEIKEIYDKFMQNEEIKKYIKNYKIFLIDYVNDINKINKFIEKKCNWNKIDSLIEEKIKKELLVTFLRKLSEKIEKDLNKSIEISMNVFEEFTSSKIEENIEYWIEKTKIKKIPYLINIHNILKKIKENVFEGIFWGDASSNAIQLITLRLGETNEKLLMLTNIIENKTEHNNIYAYVTEEIKKRNHEEFLKKIENKITSEELNQLQNDEDNKYRIMPASYGMGINKNLKNMEIRLSDRKEIWEKLNNKQKIKVSKYIWNLTFEILKEIDFDLEKYKNFFKTFEEYNLCTWFNDYGFPIVPINTLKSKRQEILKKINLIEMKIKNEIEEKKKIKLIKKKDKLKKKREWDDKNFWKRTLIKTNEDKIYIRLYHPNIIINKRETRQALIPNSIHSYDASVMALVIEICKNFEIEVLVIHDSIGCELIYGPIIKIIFKIANIIILEKNTKKKPFPFNEKWLKKHYKLDKEEKIIVIIQKIMESTNFFR